jgi:predicted lipoprotein with Yx(FWY)xxD motif
MQFPHGISSFEYRMAPGLLLAVGVGVATPGGKALYAFVGTPAEESKLSSVFRPRYASALDRHVGEFTVRQRSDGTPQWAFRGAPLYTCDCDVEAGDVNGKGIIGIVPALLLRYPMPPEVGLRRHQIAGGHLVEAATNQTLYYRDRVQDHFNPDNRRPLEGPVDPGIGAILGTKHCDAQCEREWRPLLARQDALPLGFWSFYARADGTRQWAYKDTAVYTHVGEPPGTLYGNETYEIRYNDGLTNPRPPVEFGMGLLWRALVP